MPDSSVVDKTDHLQRRHRWSAVAVAVLKKFREDQSQYMAAMLAFWAFFSIFPLLLVLVSLLGFVLSTGTKNNVLHHVASMFPLLDSSTVGHLTGSVWAIVIGGITALWSGTSVMRTAEHAFDSVWEIPMTERPKMIDKLRRSLWALSTIGLGLVLSSFVSAFVTGESVGVNLGWAGRLAGFVVAVALDIAVFLAAFRTLTNGEVTLRDVLPGAVFSGSVFWILQQLSSLIVSRRLHHAQATYGHFATVITILWWFYLQGLVTLLGAQLNVVLKHGLHPRSLSNAAETEADSRALKSYARERTYVEEERVVAELPADRPPDDSAEGTRHRS